jgi:hypothetical protein
MRDTLWESLHRQIQACIKLPESMRYVDEGLRTIASCVGASIELVQVLHQMTQGYVSRGVWGKLHDLYREEPERLRTMPRVLRKIGCTSPTPGGGSKCRSFALRATDVIKMS